MNATTSMPVLDFSSYIAERTHDFTGRKWLFDEFHIWLTTRNAPRYFTIVGEPGIGKTAIAARLTQLHPMAAVHFCIAQQVDTVDPLNFVRSLSRQLTSINGFAQQLLADTGTQIDVHIDSQDNYGQIIGVRIENWIGESQSALKAFNRAVITPLKELYANGFKQQLVILVDALDEAVQQQWTETVVDLLAHTQGLPEQVRFVLTSRKDSRVLRQFEQLQLPIQLLNADRIENMQDVREYVQNQLKKSKVLQWWQAEYKKPSQVLVNRIAKASGGNFLYLVYLLPALANGTQQLNALNTLPQGLSGMYRELLRTRIVGKDLNGWRSSYRPLLGVLAATRDLLTANQLAHFTHLNEQTVDDLLLEIQQFLDPTHISQGKYRLYHRSIAEFLCYKERAQEFWIDLKPIHESIVSSYQGKATSWDEVRWRQTDEYGLLYLAIHLYALRDRDEFRQKLYQLICKSFMHEKYTRFGSHRPFTEDILLTLQAIADEEPANLVQEVRINLIYATLGSSATNVPRHILAALVLVGQLEKAVNLVALMHDPFQQVMAYTAIFGALQNNENTKTADVALVVNNALAVAAAVKERSDRVAILTTVGEALGKLGERARAIIILNQAVAVADTMKDPMQKVLRLTELAKAFVEVGEHAQAISILNQARTIDRKSDYSFIRPNEVVEILIQAEQFDQARKAAEEIDNPSYHVLARLGRIDQAVKTAQRISEPYWKAQALADVAHILAQEGKHARAVSIADQALAIASRLEAQNRKAFVQCEVADILFRAGEKMRANAIIDQTLAIAISIGNYSVLKRLIYILIGNGEDPARVGPAVNGLLEKAGEIKDPNNRLSVLGNAAETLALLGERTRAITLISEALTLVEMIGMEGQKEQAQSLIALAWMLVRYNRSKHVVSIIGRVLALVEAIEFNLDKVHVLSGAAMALIASGEPDRAITIINQALTIASATPRPLIYSVLDVLPSLARAGVHADALSITSKVLVEFTVIKDTTRADETSHKEIVLKAAAEVFRILAQGGQADQALEAAQRIDDPYSQAKILSAVAQGLTQAGQLYQALDVTMTIEDANCAADTLSIVAQELVRSGDADRALQLLEGITVPYAQAYILSELAPILVLTGEHTRARSAVNQILTVEDTVFQFQGKVVQTLILLGEYSQAISIMNNVLTTQLPEEYSDLTDFEHQKLIRQVLESLTSVGQITLALEVIQTVEDFYERDAALGTVVDVLAQTGQVEQALKIAQTMTKAPYEILELLTQGGQVEQALKIALADVDAEDPSLKDRVVIDLGRIGDTLTEMGQQHEAVKVFHLALSRARRLGRQGIFRTLQQFAITLGAIDEGQTLWLVHEAIQEVDRWWEAT